VDVTTIASWLAENGVKIKNDLSPLLTTLGVTSVLELAELGKEETNQVVAALKNKNQKLKAARDILLPRLMNRTIEV
jgi:alcohol dehydrogenase YqhD (iron-dependent ADH family)